MSTSLFDAPPLRGLDAPSRERVAAAGRRVVLGDGERLFARGQDADDLFVLLRGRVRLSSGHEVVPGQTLGEGAFFGLPHRADAHGVGPSTEVFVVSAGLLQRSWARSGGEPMAAAERRRLERAVVADVLRGLLPDIEADALDVLLDAASVRTVETGSFLAHAGDRAPAAALLLDGVLHRRAAGSKAVRDLVLPPEMVGIEAVRPGGTWAFDVVAAAPSRVAWLRGDALRRSVGDDVAQLQRPGRAAARADVLRRMQVGPTPAAIDVHRLERARSLLVIDQDACVRCGGCTRACAASHDDGLARMAREGPRVAAHDGERGAVPWLLATSCQHCSHPACLPDCPTGAIARASDGRVRIEAALCTGCGACAKACPWDAIETAPRPATDPQPDGGPYEHVAVKCDLCEGRSGPACVQACPTEALARIEPARRWPEAASVLDRDPPATASPRSGAPTVALWVLAAGLPLAVFLGGRGWAAGYGPGLALGYVAAASLVGAVAYGLLRRRGPRRLTLHVALGVLTLAAAWGHAGGWGEGVDGLLAGVVATAGLLGVYGWWAYRGLPSRLTRLQAEAPSAFRDSAEDREHALMLALGGRSEALKRLTARLLMPYMRRPLGGVALLLSGRSLQEEMQRLRAELVRALGASRIQSMEGLDAVLSIAVQHRAHGPRRWLGWALRGWLAPHVVLSVAAVGLLVVHVSLRGVG